MGAGMSIAGDARVSHQSFGNSFCGMLVGLVLFPLALVLTGFNEADYVTRQEVLAKAREAAHPHDCLDTLAGQSAQTLLFLQVRAWVRVRVRARARARARVRVR